jgi:hypothetical protein
MFTIKKEKEKERVSFFFFNISRGLSEHNKKTHKQILFLFEKEI